MCAYEDACKRGDLETIIKLNHMGLNHIVLPGDNLPWNIGDVLYHIGRVRDRDNLPIRIAVEYGHISVTAYLLFTRTYNYNLSNIAAIHGHQVLFKYLMELENDGTWITREAFRNAAEKGHVMIIKYLVNEHGLNIHNKYDFALRIASKHGHLPVVKYLLEKGARVHAGEDLSLRVASYSGYLSVVECLIKHGANVNNNTRIKTKYHITVPLAVYNECALVNAINNEHLQVVQCLLKHGAHTAGINEKCMKRLLQKKHQPFVKMLLKSLSNN